MSGSARFARVVSFATRILANKINGTEMKIKRGNVLFAILYYWGFVNAGILYAMRLHAEHVRNIFAGSPGLQIII